MGHSGGVVLVAASGLARETLAVVRAADPELDVAVLDDDPGLHGTDLSGAPVVGGLEEVKRFEAYDVLVCAGRGTSRRTVVARLRDLGVDDDRFGTVLHPSVDVPAGCAVGVGSILLAGVVLTADVTVGRHVVAMPHVTLTHDDVVDDYVTLAAGVTLAGSVHVGEASYLGMNATVREGLHVGAGSTLGMGSALLRDLPDGETWAGVPARRLTGRR